MQLSISQPELITLLLVSTRLLAWLMVAPPIATAGVPKVVRVALSVGLALPLIHGNVHAAPTGDFAAVAGATLEQVVIGTGLGFLTRMLFTAIEAAGGLLDLFGGFSLSAAYEPLSNTTTSIFGKFYGILSTTLIFVTNAHLVIFAGIMHTFHSIPLDATVRLSTLDTQIAGVASGLFVAALQIAGPILIVLFLADIALGVLNRIAPQLNAFSMSFPVKIGLTLLLVGGSMTLMPQVVLRLAGQADSVITAVTG